MVKKHPEAQEAGLRLRRLRETAGLTQDEVQKRARALDYDWRDNRMSRLETGEVGEIKLYDACAIADVFRLTLVQVADLFGLRTDPETPPLPPDRKISVWNLARAYETLPEPENSALLQFVSRGVETYEGMAKSK